ncbi:MAG: polyphenol oxidase family protein [Patulibacter minatonensis]
MTTPAFTEIDGTLRASAHGAHALFTSRAGGVSAAPYDSLNLGPWTADDAARVRENQARVAALASEIAGSDRRLVLGQQVHESSVATHAAGFEDVAVNGVDAHVTDRDDLAVAVLTADCLAVALLAPWGVGVAHAGWRGLAGGIVGGTVGELLALAGEDADASQIAAFIGPSAGACCYEVGEEVHASFAGWPGHDPSQPTIDLPALARAALEHEGVGSVAVAGRCTICDGRYFSHRASAGTTGRQAGIAWRG